MLHQNLRLFLLALSASALTIHADTFKMKDGTILNVEVLEVNADSYSVIQYYSKSIKEKKTISIDDVMKWEKGTTLDKKDYAKLIELSNVPDGKSEEYYEIIIKKQFEKFIIDHPSSMKKKSVKEMIDALRAEQAQIAAGNIKLNGKFISIESTKSQLFDIEAGKKVSALKELLEKKKILTALRVYEGIREGYLNSNAFSEIAEQVKETLVSLDNLLKKKALSPDAPPSEDVLKSLSINEARRLTSEYESNRAKIENKIQRDLRNKEIWVTIDLADISSIRKSQTLTKARIKELELLISGGIQDGGTMYTSLIEALENRQADQSKKILAQFKAIKPPSKLLEELNAQVRILKEELQAEKKQKKAEIREAKILEVEEMKKAALNAKKEGDVLNVESAEPEESPETLASEIAQ